MTEAATSFTANDVLCGRGGAVNRMEGNVRYREMMEEFTCEYVQSRKTEKRQIAAQIVSLVKEKGGRFLEKDGETWAELSIDRAIKKTIMAMRELMTKNYRSENRKKKRGRPPKSAREEDLGDKKARSTLEMMEGQTPSAAPIIPVRSTSSSVSLVQATCGGNNVTDNHVAPLAYSEKCAHVHKETLADIDKGRMAVLEKALLAKIRLKANVAERKLSDASTEEDCSRKLTVAASASSLVKSGVPKYAPSCPRSPVSIDDGKCSIQDVKGTDSCRSVGTADPDFLFAAQNERIARLEDEIALLRQNNSALVALNAGTQEEMHKLNEKVAGLERLVNMKLIGLEQEVAPPMARLTELLRNPLSAMQHNQACQAIELGRLSRSGSSSQMISPTVDRDSPMLRASGRAPVVASSSQYEGFYSRPRSDSTDNASRPVPSSIAAALVSLGASGHT